MIGRFRWSFSQAGCWVVAGFGVIAIQEKRGRHHWRFPQPDLQRQAIGTIGEESSGGDSPLDRIGIAARDDPSIRDYAPKTHSRFLLFPESTCGKTTLPFDASPLFPDRL